MQLWAPIQSWLEVEEVGNAAFQRVVSGLDTDRDYHTWLSEQLVTQKMLPTMSVFLSVPISVRCVACRSQLRVRLSGHHSAWTQKENEGPRPCQSMA